MLRKRTLIPLLVALAVVAALGVELYLRAGSPPESDAIVYILLKTLRTATHFDTMPIARGAGRVQDVTRSFQRLSFMGGVASVCVMPTASRVGQTLSGVSKALPEARHLQFVTKTHCR